jgi:hypothetical protein
MNVYSTLQIGSFHLNHCEDFTITSELGSGKRLIAVMDGCTMGEESVFASILLGKTSKTSAGNISIKTFGPRMKQQI